MTVPRSTIKVKKWAVTQFLEISTLSPKYVKYCSHSLAYEITHPYKNWQPYILVPLVFQDGLHSIYGVYFSLNKPSFTLVKFSLEFFPMWSQEPILGSSPRDSAMTWDVTILLHPTLSCNSNTSQYECFHIFHALPLYIVTDRVGKLFTVYLIKLPNKSSYGKFFLIFYSYLSYYFIFSFLFM